MRNAAGSVQVGTAWKRVACPVAMGHRPAVPQAGCGWQGQCCSDGVPSGPGSQEPFIA